VTHSRVLIVAHRTAASPQLAASVANRAAAGPCQFTLLVPACAEVSPGVIDREGGRIAEAERRLSRSLPLLSVAAGAEVVGVVGARDPLAAVQDALSLLGFDEVMVSMLPAGMSSWRRLDLPGRLRSLGIRVTAVTGSDTGVTPLPAA
jgi:hypothetical protein